MKKKLSILMSLCFIMSFTAIPFMVQAAEITITTGAEFVAAAMTNAANTYIIEGTQTLNDGSTGIILPDTYTPKTGFLGTLTGVAGKNNIQFPASTQEPGDNIALFVSIGNGKATIENIVLKGEDLDGKGTINATVVTSSTSYGVLVRQSAFTTADITIKNVINNLNVTVPSTALLGLAGFIGSTNTPMVIENCVNNGNISSASSDTSTNAYCIGGILGTFDSQYFEIKSCYNYGNIQYTGNRTNTKIGGIAGGTKTNSTAAAGIVSGCGNYGNVTSTGTGSAGIAGGFANANLNIEKCFNAGNISAQSRPSGIAIVGVTNMSITNCFNVGVITATGSSIDTNVFPAGITCSSIYNPTVQNCYNVGTIVGGGSYSKEITKSTNATNNYHINNAATGTQGGTLTTKNNLALSLPSGFSSDVWEHVSTTGVNKYSLPQIKNNTYVREDLDFYFEPQTSIYTGTGDYADPYIILNEQGFVDVMSLMNSNKYAKLASDIDLDDSGYVPVSFAGNLDGQGHTINFNFNNSSSSSTDVKTGLFTTVSEGETAVIENLVLTGSYIGKTPSINSGTGALIGVINKNTNVTLRNIENQASVFSANSYVGGIIGSALGRDTTGSLTLDGLINRGEISASDNQSGYLGGVGGIIGFMPRVHATSNYTVTDCKNFGTIVGYQGVGGIIGQGQATSSSITVSNCANYGTVTGSKNVGGIIGYMNNTVVTLSESFNAGNVTATSDSVAGLCTFSGSEVSTVSNCFNIGKIQGASAVYGLLSAVRVEITNSYNSGELNITSGGVTHPIIAENSNTTLTNCYYTESISSSLIPECEYINAMAILISPVELSNGLPEGFSSDVWEIDSAEGFFFPQLSDNKIELDQEDLYELLEIQAAPNSLTGSYYPFEATADDEEGKELILHGEKITGKYIVAFSKFEKTEGYNVKYGILLSEGTESLDLLNSQYNGLGLRTWENGGFGILFWGRGLKSQTDYSFRAYAVYTNAIVGGETTTLYGEVQNIHTI